MACRRDGRTVLLTTHYMEEAEILCDRLAIMDHGHILEMGTVDELVSQAVPGAGRPLRSPWTASTTPSSRACPASRSVKHDDDDVLLYTRDVGADHRRAPGRSPRRAASSHRTSAIRRATLEDVFLDLTGRALRD